jgi:hypothetical protein
MWESRRRRSKQRGGWGEILDFPPPPAVEKYATREIASPSSSLSCR